MVHTAYGKLVSLILIPAFVLAQLFCTCQASARPTSTAVPAASVAKHSCCAGAATPKKVTGHCDPDGCDTHGRGTPHDSKCPHCGGGSSQVVSSERVVAPEFQPALLPFDFLSLASRYLPPAALVSRLQSFTPWLADLSPPPDLLRVKCSLQI